MSINLHCNEVELWQTPTHITNMCFSNNDGGSQGIKYRYLEWVKSHLNGVFQNKQEMNEKQEHIKAHIEEINSFKKLTFFVI